MFDAVGAGANVLVFGRFENALISDSRPYFAPGLDYQMPSKSLKWQPLKRRRQSETRDAKKKERRIGSMSRPAEFIHFRLGADTMPSRIGPQWPPIDALVSCKWMLLRLRSVVA